MAEELRRMGAPAPMHIAIRYDVVLQEITRVAEEPMWMGEGGTFLFLLQSVFDSHPEINRRYPPGTLKLAINGLPPKPYSPLFDGDVVEFSVA